MPSFYTILTDVGQAKLANAIALGQTIDITDLAVGDGNGALPVPETSRTALVNEVRRAPINLSEVDAQNPSWVVVEQVLPPDVGGWTIREIGVFDIEGDLIGYGNYPETYKPVLAEGSSRTQTIRFVMEVSDTEAVTLKVDPSVVLATRGYADNLMTTHEASRNHPSGTTVAKGMLRLATADRVKQYNAADPVTAAALRDSGLLGAAVTTVTSADSPKALTEAEAGVLLVDASGGDVTLTLPATNGNGGLEYTFMRIDTSANAVTVEADGTDTIDGAESVAVVVGDRRTQVCDGASDWKSSDPVASRTVAGRVELADDSEAQSLADLLKALTPGTLEAAFRGGNQLISGTGYQKLPGGLILQWGKVQSSGAQSGTINFPVAFPNVALNAQITDLAGSISTVVPHAAGSDLTATGLNWYSSGDPSYAFSFYWFAIGH